MGLFSKRKPAPQQQQQQRYGGQQAPYPTPPLSSPSLSRSTGPGQSMNGSSQTGQTTLYRPSPSYPPSSPPSQSLQTAYVSELPYTQPGSNYTGFPAASNRPAGAQGGGGGGQEEGRLSIGIDMGTTFSGVSYASSRLLGPNIVRCILSWPGSFETYRKVPTCILYGITPGQLHPQVLAWGLEAKSAPVTAGMYKVEFFKLWLDPEALRTGRSATTARLPELPPGIEPLDVVIDFLSLLWRYAKEKITEEIGSVVDLDTADVILTVPAAWDARGCSAMRDAALKANMVQSASAGDRKWRDRLKIITEPEAAAIQASTLTALNLRPSQSFIVCDLGGGTCDLSAYKLIGQLSHLEIAEMCSRTGANCGSLFLDLRFEDLLREILKDHPIHTDGDSLRFFRREFAETDKLSYQGEEDDDTTFRFTCFNVEDPEDLSIGLEHGELCIYGKVLRERVFDPVINQVLALIKSQLDKVPSKSVDALICVGGFSASDYLLKKIKAAFPSVRQVSRPTDADIATLQGAARYGMAQRGGRNAVSSVISPRSYIMKVKLPAENIDLLQRPGYITRNDAGVEVCENRLSYLISKNAVLRKGQILQSRYCKYSRGASDSLFTAVLYASDSENIYRYTDQGETYELCHWTVDLATLPAFQYNASQTAGAFWTEFNLGLELDSAEVRGVLLSDEGEICGSAVFSYVD